MTIFPNAHGPRAGVLLLVGRRRVPRATEDARYLTRLRRRGRHTGRRQTAVQHRQPVDLPCDPQISVDRWDELVDMFERPLSNFNARASILCKRAWPGGPSVHRA